MRVAFGVRAFEQIEGLVVLPQAEMHQGECKRGNVPAVRGGLAGRGRARDEPSGIADPGQPSGTNTCYKADGEAYLTGCSTVVSQRFE